MRAKGGMTCLEGDVPCDPMETAEVFLTLEDAQDTVEKALASAAPSP